MKLEVLTERRAAADRRLFERPRTLPSLTKICCQEDQLQAATNHRAKFHVQLAFHIVHGIESKNKMFHFILHR